MWLFVAFLAIPLIEIALFIQIGGVIGLGWTLAIVVITAVLGTVMVRTQGALALGQLRSSFDQMQDPTEPLAHGAMILFSGALLLTPGFFTDTIGFLLLIPSVRTAAFRSIKARVSIQSVHTQTRTRASQNTRGTTIEGEFTEMPDDADTRRGRSGWTDH